MSPRRVVVPFAVQCRAVGLPEPQVEYCFARPRKWRFDYAWPEFQIAVECEGSHWTNGRHTRGQGFEDDCEKYGAAFALGWNVLRGVTRQFNDGTVVGWLQQHMLLLGSNHLDPKRTKHTHHDRTADTHQVADPVRREHRSPGIVRDDNLASLRQKQSRT